MVPITYRGVVYPWHCDHVGHMNVMHYAGKFDQATWNFFALLGITPSFLRTQGRGMAALEQKINYRNELHAGDVVEISTRLLDMEGKKIRFTHEMVNCETRTVAATTELFAVHMDTGIRKSCPFPENILDRGRTMMTEHASHD